MTNEQLLEKYQNEEVAIRQQVSIVREKIQQANLAIFKEKYGIEIGSIVICRNTKYIITKIRAGYSSHKPWLTGNIQKKDGSFGTRERNLYDDWELLGECYGNNLL